MSEGLIWTRFVPGEHNKLGDLRPKKVFYDVQVVKDIKNIPLPLRGKEMEDSVIYDAFEKRTAKIELAGRWAGDGTVLEGFVYFLKASKAIQWSQKA